MANREVPGEIGIPLVVLLIWLIRKGGQWLESLFDPEAQYRRRDRKARRAEAKREHHGYGINYQMRRRKLDVTRKDSSFSLSVGEKIRRQAGWLFGRRKRR